MKTFLIIISLFLVISCANNSTNSSTQSKENTYNNINLLIDSIANLPLDSLVNKAEFISDSIFQSSISYNKKISASDLQKLKHSKGFIDFNLAKRIFGEDNIDSSYLAADTKFDAAYKYKFYEGKGGVWITYYSFSSNNKLFNNFAILPLTDSNPRKSSALKTIYFFTDNTLISKHSIYSYYEPIEIKTFEDIDGNTIVYYDVTLTRGTGVYWTNFFFYKYFDNKLLPVLNHIHNAYNDWGVRHWELNANLVSTKPLQFKIDYEVSFNDTTNAFVKDSALIQYNWNKNALLFEGNYSNSPITREQILSFGLSNSELLFIKTYRDILKECLKDSTQRVAASKYIEIVK